MLELCCTVIWQQSNQLCHSQQCNEREKLIWIQIRLHESPVNLDFQHKKSFWSKMRAKCWTFSPKLKADEKQLWRACLLLPNDLLSFLSIVVRRGQTTSRRTEHACWETSGGSFTAKLFCFRSIFLRRGNLMFSDGFGAIQSVHCLCRSQTKVCIDRPWNFWERRSDLLRRQWHQYQSHWSFCGLTMTPWKKCTRK